MSVVSNMPFLLHLSSFVLSRRKPICMGLYLAPCHIVGIQWLTLWNWLKTGGPETKRVDLSFLICPTCLSCDDVMKHRKWLGRFFLPPLPPPPQSREQEMGDKVWQVQKELEELQARSHGTAEVPTRLTQFRRVVRHVRWAWPVGGRVPFLPAAKPIKKDWRFRFDLCSEWLCQSWRSPHRGCFESLLLSPSWFSSGKILQSDGSVTTSDWQAGPVRSLFFFPFCFHLKVLPLRLDFPFVAIRNWRLPTAELRDIFLAYFAVIALAPQSCVRPPRSLQIRCSSAESLKNVFFPLERRRWGTGQPPSLFLIIIIWSHFSSYVCIIATVACKMCALEKGQSLELVLQGEVGSRCWAVLRLFFPSFFAFTTRRTLYCIRVAFFPDELIVLWVGCMTLCSGRPVLNISLGKRSQNVPVDPSVSS